MHYTAYIDDLDVPRWIILAGGASLLFGMVHVLFRRTASSGSTPRLDGGVGTTIPDLSTSANRSGSVPSEPHP
jgi:hypothetical protein